MLCEIVPINEYSIRLQFSSEHFHGRSTSQTNFRIIIIVILETRVRQTCAFKVSSFTLYYSSWLRNNKVPLDIPCFDGCIMGDNRYGFGQYAFRMVANVVWHPIVRLRNDDLGDEDLETEVNGQLEMVHLESGPNSVRE